MGKGLSVNRDRNDVFYFGWCSNFTGNNDVDLDLWSKLSAIKSNKVMDVIFPAILTDYKIDNEQNLVQDTQSKGHAVAGIVFFAKKTLITPSATEVMVCTGPKLYLLQATPINIRQIAMQFQMKHLDLPPTLNPGKIHNCFVYGSLMSGEERNSSMYDVAKDVKLVEAKTKGCLVSVNDQFPGILPLSSAFSQENKDEKLSEWVIGEVYSFDELVNIHDQLKILDDIEGYYANISSLNTGNLYQRVLCLVETLDAEKVFAWTYLLMYHNSLTKSSFIPEGNWRHYKKSLQETKLYQV